MRYRRPYKKVVFVIALLICILGCDSSNRLILREDKSKEARQRKSLYFPEEEWLQYSNPESVGFKIDLIREARDFYDSINGHSLLVLHKGKVLINWGDNTRRMPSTSIRKSFLSALIGLQIKERKLGLNQRIEEFNLTHFDQLDSTEKTATIEDLLSSSSGIYLPAAYESDVWTERKPPRGSHLPGEFWYYNNWDFNTLGSIYNSLSTDSMAIDFKTRIAMKLRMQDFRPDLDFKYFYENGVETPAYLFKVSARDMARFGLLYLRKGRWKGNQIIPKNWIEQSTSPRHKAWNEVNYGFLWWNRHLKDGSFIYYANGSGVQGIYVVPKMDLVMVFRADTFIGPIVQEGLEVELLEMICGAYDKGFESNSRIDTQVTEWSVNPIRVGQYQTKEWVGKYSNNLARQIEIKLKGNQLTLETKIADFLMYTQSDSSAWVQDLNVQALLRSSKKLSGTSQLNKKELIIFK